MAQVLKDEVRDRITEAAEKLFFHEGFKKATMGMIAEEAGVATGNIYKYFANKDLLYKTIIGEEFINDLYRLTEKRVQTLSAEIMDDISINSLEENREANNLLRFWIKNRVKTVILLDKSEGSIYESVRNTIRGLISILTSFEKEKDIKAAFNMSWAYHYAGIKGLLEVCG